MKRGRGRAILIIEKSPKYVKHKSLETGSNALLRPVLSCSQYCYQIKQFTKNRV